MSEEPVHAKGKSMFNGAPRNPTLPQLQLIKNRPPPPDEVQVRPEPSVPAYEVPLDELRKRSGPRMFANKARLAGYEVRAVRSVGPRLHADGTWGPEVEVTSIRCARDGKVELVACWDDNGFEVAFGVRATGERRLATAYQKKKGTDELVQPLVRVPSLQTALAWLDHGVDGDLAQPVDDPPTAREAALLIARSLGGTLVGTKVDGEALCPMVTTDAQATRHLQDVHDVRTIPALRGPVQVGDRQRFHDFLHTHPRNHRHVEKPLGET